MSLLSSSMTGRGGIARVTAIVGAIVATGITITMATAMLTTNGEEATPIKRGQAIASLLQARPPLYVRGR